MCRFFRYFFTVKYILNIPNAWPDTCVTISINYGKTLIHELTLSRVNHADDVLRYVGFASTIKERICGPAAFVPPSSRLVFFRPAAFDPLSSRSYFVSLLPSARSPASNSFAGCRRPAACGPMIKSLAVRLRLLLVGRRRCRCRFANVCYLLVLPTNGLQLASRKVL